MSNPRIMIAAPSSGCGKTTFTCALLRAFIRRGQQCAAFKCGPDYIDPMFHRACVGACRGANLDLFFCEEPALRQILIRESRNMDLSILEGAMGYYDGLGAKSERASAWDIARATQTPVVLLIHGQGASVSLAPLIQGFLSFRSPSMIQAVVFNQVSPMVYPLLKDIVEKECGIPVAGYLPPMEDCSLESRHLGLVTASEINGLSEKLDRIAEQIQQTVNLELLEGIASKAPDFKDSPQEISRLEPVRIAVAKDRAFCFYYEESLELLEAMGAELVPFSPLSNSCLPQADALLLGGGYPELYAQALSENQPMRESIKKAIQQGMPAIAECGGFLYLGEALEGSDGISYPMAGVLKGKGYRTPKLQRFGYTVLTAKQDSLLGPAGSRFKAHEFHYWDSTNPGEAFQAEKPLRGRHWQCGYGTSTLYAGFPHLYLAGMPEAAVRFLKAAVSYRKGK